jgi:hypothetical protein
MMPKLDASRLTRIVTVTCLSSQVTPQSRTIAERASSTTNTDTNTDTVKQMAYSFTKPAQQVL